MSLKNDLKERLTNIILNGYQPADESDVWPLTQEMLRHLGSTDPELRDKLINRVLGRWAELYFDSQQLQILLNRVLDDDHLYLGLGEEGSDSVFMRSFSSLALASLIARHRSQAFLSGPAVQQTLDRMLVYLSKEKDLRGYLPGKGWAHALAHAADALDELALCPELGKPALLDLLQGIREAVLGAAVVLVDDEDERLVTAVLSSLQRQLLSASDLSRWVSGFASFALPPTYQEWLRKRTNIKHFLRSLYFRLSYEAGIGLLEPTLSETLQELSSRRIPEAYF